MIAKRGRSDDTGKKKESNDSNKGNEMGGERDVTYSNHDSNDYYAQTKKNKEGT